jgi:hypothetical protein
MQMKDAIGTGPQPNMPTIAHVHIMLTYSSGDHHA